MYFYLPNITDRMYTQYVREVSSTYSKYFGNLQADKNFHPSRCYF
jgi:hypothetical protein